MSKYGENRTKKNLLVNQVSFFLIERNFLFIES